MRVSVVSSTIYTARFSISGSLSSMKGTVPCEMSSFSDPSA